MTGVNWVHIFHEYMKSIVCRIHLFHLTMSVNSVRGDAYDLLPMSHVAALSIECQ